MSNTKLTELGKRRGFFFQTSEVYGGVGGFYTFGPQGAQLKRNIEDSWRETFTVKEGNKEIEAPTIMSEPVFEASGHLEGFDDMIIECPDCGQSSRADHLVEDNTEIEEAEGLSTEKIEEIISENSLICPSCGEELGGIEVEDFNLMFATNIGPGDSQPGYLRPETAQGIFIEFPRLKQYARNQLPFGITQIGKAYRNEISPRKGLVRVREFTQAELEHFVDPGEDTPDIRKVDDVELKLYPTEKQGGGEYVETTVNEAIMEDIIEVDWVAYYLGVAKEWYESIGIDMDRFRFRQHQKGERAHYATDCWDAEAEVDGDWIEIAGFAYRGCYDLKKHGEHSGEDFTVFKEYDETVEEEVLKVQPDMGWLGPEYGSEASNIAEKLEQKIQGNPGLVDEETVSVEVDEIEYNIPMDVVEVEEVVEKRTGEHITPHVVEPSFGVDRTFYSVLAHNFKQDEIDGEERNVLRLASEIAPVDVAVFPLMDKDGMAEKAREIAGRLREKGFSVEYDDSGNIGRRYRRQDEVGTPFCITIDHETLDENTVTVRDRDSTKQKRVEVKSLPEKINNFSLNGF